MDIYRKATLWGLVLLAGGLVTGCEGGGDESPMASPEHQAVYRWQFEAGNREGWTMESSHPNVGWSVEHSLFNPAFIGEEAPYVGETDMYSLNYNRYWSQYFAPESDPEEFELDFDTGLESNRGSATSPRIQVSGLQDPKLVFSCTFDMENFKGIDVRSVAIYQDDTGLLLKEVVLGFDGVEDSHEGLCIGWEKWHSHVIGLDAAWGSVRVRFNFDTVDSFKNNGKGWFLDDIQVQAALAPGQVIPLQAK